MVCLVSNHTELRCLLLLGSVFLHIQLRRWTHFFGLRSGFSGCHFCSCQMRIEQETHSNKIRPIFGATARPSLFKNRTKGMNDALQLIVSSQPVNLPVNLVTQTQCFQASVLNAALSLSSIHYNYAFLQQLLCIQLELLLRCVLL